MSETVVAGLVGGVVASGVAGVLTLVHLRMSLREERRKDALRYRREHLVEPVIGFTDDLLSCVSETYWTHTDRLLENAASKASGGQAEAGTIELLTPESLKERMANLRNREAIIDARVAVLRDHQLSESYDALTSSIWKVRSAAAKGGFGAGREEAQKASALGAEVIAGALRVAGER